MELEGQTPAFFERASDEQIEWISPAQRWIAEEADARIRLMASENTRELSGVDPARQTLRQKATSPLMEAMMARAAAGEHRWALTIFPTNAYASERLDEPRGLRGLLLPRLPRRPGGSGRRLEAGLRGDAPARGVDRGPRGGPHHRPRHRPEAERRRPPLHRRRRQAQHAGRRVLHRPGRGLGRGRDHLPPAGDTRAARSRASASGSRAARSSTRAPSAARSS